MRVADEVVAEATDEGGDDGDGDAPVPEVVVGGEAAGAADNSSSLFSYVWKSHTVFT